jgi:hypothetical protein
VLRTEEKRQENRMLELTDIALLLVLAVPGYFFWRAVAIREQALHAVKRHLKQQDLQLLDDAVALRSVWLRRNKQQRLCIERIYQFEFSSTRVDRYNGRITLLDDQVVDIQLEAYRIEPLEHEPLESGPVTHDSGKQHWH